MSDDQAGPGPQTRRALLAGAGAVGASVVLAACGTGDDDAYDAADDNAPAGNTPAGSPSASAPAGDAPADDGAKALVSASDIPVGGGKILSAEELVVTQPEEGTFKAFSSICTHQGCPVTSVDGGTINCSCHNSKFGIADGAVKGGPATKKLPEKKVKIAGGKIVLA